MKKLFLIATTLILCFAGLLSTHALEEKNFGPSDILPLDYDFLISINTTLAPMTHDELRQTVSNFIAIQDPTTEEKMIDHITRVLKNNIASYAIKLPSSLNKETNDCSYCSMLDGETVSMFFINEKDFQKIITMNAETLVTTNYNDIPVYRDTWTGSIYTKLKNLFVISHQMEVIEKIIDNFQNPNQPKLKDNLGYQIASNMKLPGNFLSMYIRPEIFLERKESDIRTFAEPFLERFNTSFQKVLEQIFEQQKSQQQ